MGWFATKQERLDKKLWRAARDGKLKRIEELLAEGANINARLAGYVWPCPLLVAADSNRPEAVKLLLAKGADPEARGNGGRTAFMLACSYGYREIAKAMLAHGFDIAAKSEGGSTPLHYAAERGWENVVSELLAKDADIHAKSHSGQTPLHNAALGGRFTIVTMLLEKGADASAIDNNGNKPESLARKYYAGVADYLRDKTAVPDVPPPAPGWTLTAPDEIVHTSEKPGTGYALTEVFNFSARMYIHIARNLKTNAESQAIRFFDEFPDKTILENAFQMLAKQGGKADRAAIYGSVLDKKRPQGDAS